MSGEKYHVYQPSQSADPEAPYYVYQPAPSADPSPYHGYKPALPPHPTTAGQVAQPADPAGSQIFSLGSLRDREACPAPPTYLETDLDLEPSTEDGELVAQQTTGGPAKEGPAEVGVSSGRTMPTLNPPSLLKVSLSLIVLGVAVVAAVLLSSLHKVEEGSVGIYFRFGALMESVTHPGIHYMLPFVTSMHQVQIRPQTDTIPPMAVITRDGIQNVFKDVQVISRVDVDKVVFMVQRFGLVFRETLVYDRVKEELRIFCANNTIDDVYNAKFLDIVSAVRRNIVTSIQRLGQGGIEVMNLVVPKPEIPSDIALNYMQVKVQWTEQLVAAQQQRTDQIRKETELMSAIADAERSKAVLRIQMEQKLLQKEAEQNLSRVENAIVREREETVADVEKYRVERQAEANLHLHTEDYVRLNLAKDMAHNTKFYFSGESSLLGGLVNTILEDRSKPGLPPTKG